MSPPPPVQRHARQAHAAVAQRDIAAALPGSRRSRRRRRWPHRSLAAQNVAAPAAVPPRRARRRGRCSKAGARPLLPRSLLARGIHLAAAIRRRSPMPLRSPPGRQARRPAAGHPKLIGTSTITPRRSLGSSPFRKCDLPNDLGRAQQPQGPASGRRAGATSARRPAAPQHHHRRRRRRGYHAQRPVAAGAGHGPPRRRWLKKPPRWPLAAQ